MRYSSIILFALIAYAGDCDVCDATATTTLEDLLGEIEMPTEADLKSAGIASDKLPVEFCSTCKLLAEKLISQYAKEKTVVEGLEHPEEEAKTQSVRSVWTNLLRGLKNLVEPDPPLPSAQVVAVPIPPEQPKDIP